MSAASWWHELLYDDWPYELPADKKRWVPTFVNEWLGRRDGWNLMPLARPGCWRQGHTSDGYGFCARCGQRESTA